RRCGIGRSAAFDRGRVPAGRARPGAAAPGPRRRRARPPGVVGMTATALPGDLTAALTAHGYRLAAPVRTLAGPAASRASVALADGRHLWVDLPADGAASLGVPVTFPAWLVQADGAAAVMSDAA